MTGSERQPHHAYLIAPRVQICHSDPLMQETLNLRPLAWASEITAGITGFRPSRPADQRQTIPSTLK